LHHCANITCSCYYVITFSVTFHSNHYWQKKPYHPLQQHKSFHTKIDIHVNQCTKMLLPHAQNTRMHMKQTKSIVDSRWRGFGSIMESTANSCFMMSLIHLDFFAIWHVPKSRRCVRRSCTDKGWRCQN
jgi:hypothetical protein